MMDGEKSFSKNDIVIAAIPLVFRYEDAAERYPMRNPSRHHHGLLYAIEGNEVYKMADYSIKTAPGSVFYLPKSASYSVELTGLLGDVICVDFEVAYPIDLRAFEIQPANVKLFSSLFFEIERCWRMNQPGRDMECRSLAYHILFEMKRFLALKYCSSEKRNRIAPGVDYLHANFADHDLRVETLAEQCGFHPRYFAQLFREIYGVSPKKYITQLRMERAKELILGNRYSVSEIALLTGYNDVYRFSKVFKQETGVPPTIYYKMEGRDV